MGRVGESNIGGRRRVQRMASVVEGVVGGMVDQGIVRGGERREGGKCGRGDQRDVLLLIHMKAAQTVQLTLRHFLAFQCTFFLPVAGTVHPHE